MSVQIHPTAQVSPNAELGEDVSIGAFSIVHDHVVLGRGSRVESYVELGYPCTLAAGPQLLIGANSLIRSHCVFYQGSQFGERLETGHRVTVRENTTAGRNLRLGTMTDIQGDCSFGDYVRAHSSVHVGKKSVIGNFVWLFPYVVLTNDPHPPSDLLQGVTVEDFAVIATMSVVLPGMRIGEHSLVAAHSMVRKDVEPHTVVGGSPAQSLCATSDILLQYGDRGPAYPWPRHFTRGFPDEVADMLRARFGDRQD